MCSVVILSAINLTACEKKDKLSLNNKEKENVLDLNIYFDSSQNINTPEISKEERVIKKDEIQNVKKK